MIFLSTVFYEVLVFYNYFPCWLGLHLTVIIVPVWLHWHCEIHLDTTWTIYGTRPSVGIKKCSWKLVQVFITWLVISFVAVTIENSSVEYGGVDFVNYFLSIDGTMVDFSCKFCMHWMRFLKLKLRSHYYIRQLCLLMITCW